MSVQALSQFDPTQFFRLPSANGTGTQRLDTKVSGIAVSNDFSGRLSVTTAEGDTITLSADIESDFRAVNYKARAEGDGTTVDVDAKYAEYSLKQEFGVTVEGDLNQQEVKDLSSLFRNVADIFKKFLSGQDAAALAQTVKLGDGFEDYSSLSDLNLNVDLERSVTVLAAKLAAEAAGRPGSLTALQVSTPTTQAVPQGEAPSTNTAILPPSTRITVPAQVAASASEPSQPSSIVQQVLDAIQQAQVEPRKLNYYFSQFLKDLEKTLQNGKPDENQAEGSQPNQAPTGLAQTESVAYLAYQSTRQNSVSLSIRT